VEVDELRDRQFAVAPTRVRVEFAQEGAKGSSHASRVNVRGRIVGRKVVDLQRRL